MTKHRFRTWLRGYVPTFLYDLIVIPKVEDCGDHEWYVAHKGKEVILFHCYHCRQHKQEQL